MGNKLAKKESATYSDGFYEGEMKNSLPHGLGKFYYNTGEQYIGNFEQGYLCGNGSYYNSEGQLIYCGEWRDNVYHGVGSLYEDGKIWYWGEWRLGETKGNGILYDHYGVPIECKEELYTNQVLPHAYPVPPPVHPVYLEYAPFVQKKEDDSQQYLPNNQDTYITMN